MIKNLINCTLFFAIILNICAGITSKELKVEVIQKPAICRETVSSGDHITTHYRGIFENGKQFDSSYDKGKPYSIQIGVGEVIKGWDIGLLGMCVGEIRKLTIPPYLAYGDKGVGKIVPPGATLIIQVELLKILKLSKLDVGFDKISKDKESYKPKEENSKLLIVFGIGSILIICLIKKRRRNAAKCYDV